jgi:hypothetical protein
MRKYEFECNLNIKFDILFIITINGVQIHKNYSNYKKYDYN